MKTSRFIVIFSMMLCIWSCTYDSENDLIEIQQDQDEDEKDIDGDSVTYENTIKAIIQSSCTGCHDSPPRNGAPFALVNYGQVSARANGILNAMSRQSGAAGAMPPSGRLPENTINQIQEWINNELPEN
ncbi:MAG: hypothetical protein ABJN95_08665 [Maribacter sp.]|uniref:hypothetical protein n=1 Tax=Maribacter sp. TaxID=1897614 RepID=UPI0032989797